MTALRDRVVQFQLFLARFIYSTRLTDRRVSADYSIIQLEFHICYLFDKMNASGEEREETNGNKRGIKSGWNKREASFREKEKKKIASSRFTLPCFSDRRDWLPTDDTFYLYFFFSSFFFIPEQLALVSDKKKKFIRRLAFFQFDKIKRHCCVIAIDP